MLKIFYNGDGRAIDYSRSPDYAPDHYTNSAIINDDRSFLVIGYVDGDAGDSFVIYCGANEMAAYALALLQHNQHNKKIGVLTIEFEAGETINSSYQASFKEEQQPEDVILSN